MFKCRALDHVINVNLCGKEQAMLLQTGGNFFFQKTCIDFSANINFLEVPESVMQAARSGLVAAVHEADGPEGTLNEHVAEQEGVRPEQVFCGNGASEVVRSLVQALKPKKALLPAPGFEEYIRPLTMAECSVTYYYTKEADGFRIPLEDFLGQITQDTDLVFFCNPSNPAAVLYERTFIEAVLKQCEAVGAVLVVDESLLDFVELAGQMTMKSGHMSRFLFIVKEFTKMFAMSGIRLGYGLCGDGALAARMEEGLLPLNKVSAVAQRAGIACTKEREFVQKTVCETAKEREWLLGRLSEIGIKAVGAANMIFFKSRPRLHAFSIMRGIMIRDCSSLEGLEQGYYRIAVRSRSENEKMIEMLSQWQDQPAG